MADSHGQFSWPFRLVRVNDDRWRPPRRSTAAVVGWGTRDARCPEFRIQCLPLEESSVGGLMRPAEGTRGNGRRPSWIGYVSVNDVDATSRSGSGTWRRRAVQPAGHLNISRFSVIADPQTATLALFKWQQPPAQEQPTEPAHAWARRLATNSLPPTGRGVALYSELSAGKKRRLKLTRRAHISCSPPAGRRSAEMTTATDGVGSVWLYYFNVGDIDAAVKAREGWWRTSPERPDWSAGRQRIVNARTHRAPCLRH